VRAEAAPSRLERTRLRTAALQARAKRVAQRAEAERARHGSVDAVFEAVDRDLEVGGGIIAGALAYRFFIWLLPCALVLIAGLGIAAGAFSTSPASAAKSVGLAGLVSNSIASAAKGSARWYALGVGVPILFFATRSVLRVLIGAHRLVWTDLRAAAPRPTAKGTVRLLGLFISFFLVSGLAAAARAHSVAGGLVTSLILIVPYAGFWLLVSMRLPHRDAPWTSLIPGALLFAVGIEVVQLVAAYLMGPWALSKQGTYGALGIAAALLIALFLVSRLMVGAALLNATLWERKTRALPESRGRAR
jgi:uncharacterized BrkB/YihY/UPF0761 family membrane protein